MWFVAATPNPLNPEEEDFFVCPEAWFLNNVIYWPQESQFHGSTMQKKSSVAGHGEENKSCHGGLVTNNIFSSCAQFKKQVLEN